MSLCDHCYAPGNCCKFMWLSTASGPITTFADEGEAGALRKMADLGMPFVPLQAARIEGERGGRALQAWHWSCPELQADGRCGIYADRPDLCRKYTPASDQLCVHFNGAEAGDPTVVAP